MADWAEEGLTRDQKFDRFYGTFSGSDMVVYFLFPGMSPLCIGEASTISYSTFREMKQVRTMGRISEKGVVRGTRTVAGTMVVKVIDRSVVKTIQNGIPALKNLGSIKADELPPFDIIISMANEYGHSARLVIYGARLIDDGMVLNVGDLYSENTFTYLAQDIDLIDGPYKEGMIPISASFQEREATEYMGKFSLADLWASKEQAEREAIRKKWNDQQEEAMKNAAKLAGLTKEPAIPAPPPGGYDYSKPIPPPTNNGTKLPEADNTPAGTIIVKCSTRGGTAIKDAMVTLHSESSGNDYTKYTDSDGKVTYQNIIPGRRVTLRAYKSGMTSPPPVSFETTVNNGDARNMVFDETGLDSGYSFEKYGDLAHDTSDYYPFPDTAWAMIQKCSCQVLAQGRTKDFRGLPFKVRVRWWCYVKNTNNGNTATWHDYDDKYPPSEMGVAEPNHDRLYITLWEGHIKGIEKALAAAGCINPNLTNYIPEGYLIEVYCSLQKSELPAGTYIGPDIVGFKFHVRKNH